MSKSSQSTQFRKVDIDELDENRFDDEQVDEGGMTGPDEGEVNSLLMSKKNGEALKAVLANPPVLSKNQAVKDKAFQLVLKVLTTTRSNEIDNALKGLTKSEVDILMKYIYRGFAQPNENSCGILLNWHEKVLAAGGLGSIIRGLTERKSI
ncbi:predicted protein [Nematostella vectensis]|uniref:Actin-related protein 2/3 complex subunit 5 n=1 Tax=Nematostella vectensis TaxID=45351 RepID=A7RWB9_NEMVE|nr:predicted protein [Nematostella vectensis]|eukprot:XP_001636298.1 predicted protein [Nematostella vectensis]